jgi:hypothetical protein
MRKIEIQNYGNQAEKLNCADPKKKKVVSGVAQLLL